MSGQEAFGLPNILVPAGLNINVEQIPGRLNIIKHYGDKDSKPELLQLLNTPKELFDRIQEINSEMEKISGISEVLRGSTKANLRAGNQLALLVNQSLESQNQLQSAYTSFMEHVANGIISIIRDFADAPRVIEIVGKSNTAAVQEMEITGESLSSVKKVTASLADPLARTPAGRLTIATELAQKGLLQDPRDFLQILQTGNLETVIEGEVSNLTFIKKENEALMAGEQVQALVTDDHARHIKDHAKLLSDPSIRNTPLGQSILAHIQEHTGFIQDPSLQPLFAALGYAPALPPEEGGGDMGQEMMPPEDVPPQV